MKNLVVILLNLFLLVSPVTELLSSVLPGEAGDGTGEKRIHHSMQWSAFIYNDAGDSIIDERHFQSLAVITIEDFADGTKVMFKHVDGRTISVIITGVGDEMKIERDENGVYAKYNFHAYDNEGDVLTLIVCDYYDKAIPLNERTDRSEFYLDFAAYPSIVYYLTTSIPKFVSEY